MKPPTTLDPAGAVRWRRWSPIALRRGTLTRQTAPAFELVCATSATLEGLRAEGCADPAAMASLSRLVHEGLLAFKIGPATGA